MTDVIIPFGEWLPDLPTLGLKGCTVATNVIPQTDSYRPFPSLATFSSSLGGRCVGAVIATDAAGNGYNYAGDASALYLLSTISFTAATRLVGGAYATDSDEYWEFANWGNTVIGVNGFTDVPQQISLGAANFVNLTIGVKAKHITTMRDFVVVGNVSDSATNVYRVRWSAINNPNSWTADAATLADYQDLPSEGGPVQKVLGGEYGVILQQRSIWRMQFVGSPAVFQFDRIHNLIGAYAAQGAVRYQNLVFFLSEDGFYSFDGATLNAIGRGKVDKFFKDDLSTVNFKRINACVDPFNKIVMWAYPSASHIGGNPDKILCYSWAFDRWSLVTGLNIQYLFTSISTPYTLESLDALFASIEDFTVSFDSSQWTGGQLVVAAFISTNRLARFNGSAMAATLTTGEFQLIEQQRAMLTEVRPTVIGLSASVTVSVVVRNTLTESASVGSVAAVPNSTGFVQTRVSSRYFRIQLETAANVEFTHIMGVEVSGVPAGRR